MRILHTSDWHIGRTFHGNPTLVALAEVFEALVAQVRDEAVDLVVVAGDVFDSSAPSAAAYRLLSQTLREIADTGASVVVTSGNHDSPARLGFQSALLRDGIHVITDPLALATPVTVTDDHGDVDVYGIPYLEPSLVRTLWPDVELRTQEQVMRHAMELIRSAMAVRGNRSIVLAHTFAAGVEATSGLEREVRATLSQGTVDVVPLAVFDGPDYVALGHIHGRQQLSERVAYSGAPLHYSFGEKDKPRGSWLIELDASGLVGTRWLGLPVPRRLVVLRGRLADILDDPAHADAADAWVAVEYTDPTPQRDAMRRLQVRFPFCATLAHTPDAVAPGPARDYSERLRAAVTDVERAEAFLVHVRAGEGLSADERVIFDDVVAARRGEEVSA